MKFLCGRNADRNHLFPGRQAIASSNQELAMKKTKIAWIIVMISVFALSSCGWFSGTGPRDGKGPRRDGTGGGPCNWFSSASGENQQERSAI